MHCGSYASRRDLRQSVMGQVLRRVATMVVIGVGIGWLLTLALKKVLVAVVVMHAGRDTALLKGLTAVLIVVGVLASIAPAHKAATIDPMQALRDEEQEDAMSGWIQDARYALRQLRKAPGFTLTAIMTLALGIGATTAMYQVVQGVLLAPLPYSAQDRLVGVAFTFPQEKPNAEQAGTTADFLKEHSRSFASVGIAENGTSGVNLAAGTGRAFQIASLKVDRGYLPTLGVQPMLGRNFSAEEDLPNGSKAVLLSYLLWKRQFNGDTGIVDRVVRINEESYTVVGVMPASLNAAGESAPGVASKGDAYFSTLHTTQFIEKVLGELERYPGVARVAAVNGLPLDRGLNAGGKPADRPGPKENVELRAVTPGYFSTLGIPVLSGRDVTTEDGPDAVPVALVSETAARKWWPGRSAIGKKVDLGGKTMLRVVGVVADTHSRSLAETPRATFYEPFAQLPDEMTKVINGWFPTTFAVRLSSNVDIAAAMQRAVANADPEIPVAKLTTMQTVIDHSVAAPRFFSYLAGGFAGFALLLTMIGLFGLMSYQVTQRTREIGIRLAVGADRSQILLLVLRRSLVLAIAGLLIGTIASLAVPRLARSVLADSIFTGGNGISGVLSSSIAALMTAGAAMLVAAFAASYLPARRAASIEPTEALRTE